MHREGNMAKKAKRTFHVQKRFEVWIGMDIEAETFDEAVELGRELDVKKMTDYGNRNGYNDYTELSGFGVSENW